MRFSSASSLEGNIKDIKYTVKHHNNHSGDSFYRKFPWRKLLKSVAAICTYLVDMDKIAKEKRSSDIRFFDEDPKTIEEALAASKIDNSKMVPQVRKCLDELRIIETNKPISETKHPLSTSFLRSPNTELNAKVSELEIRRQEDPEEGVFAMPKRPARGQINRRRSRLKNMEGT